MTYTIEQQRENRKKWVEALRSGKYKQGFYDLRDVYDNFCCLGILCEIAGEEKYLDEDNNFWIYGPKEENNTAGATDFAKDFVGLIDGLGHFESGVLSSMNDNGVPFDQIADVIESEPEGLFHD
jgi:hypothetical protein